MWDRCSCILIALLVITIQTNPKATNVDPAGSTGDENPTRLRRRIVLTKIGDGIYPYMASLRDNEIGHFCSGTIVTNRWVLTASDCIHNKKPCDITVVVGSNRIDESGERYRVSKIIARLVGLVRVHNNMTFGFKVRPVNLPTEEFTKSDYPANLLSWGLTDDFGETRVLDRLEVKVITREECEAAGEPADKICTLNDEEDGYCNGENGEYAGGPLVADGVQIGIIIARYNCHRRAPDVYLRVYPFVDWIEKKIRTYNKSYHSTVLL